MPERYTPGYSSNATNFMAKRSLDTHGAFFKPYLRPGTKLLNCGCGTGTIALGLAKAIAPGTLTGIVAKCPSSVAAENVYFASLQSCKPFFGIEIAKFYCIWVIKIKLRRSHDRHLHQYRYTYHQFPQS
jgi:hypothetical protein